MDLGHVRDYYPIAATDVSWEDRLINLDAR
jgi:hypothetical protein